MTSRELAVRALLKMEDGGYSNLVFDVLCREYPMSKQETAFAAALFYGCVERKLTLDEMIGRFSSVVVNKLDGTIRQLLRIALYQIFYMETPDSAAVNESVQLAKRMSKSRLSGFLNGVLRAVLRDEEKAKQLPQDPFSALSFAYSCPEPLVRMWDKPYGRELTLQMLKASLGQPPLFIRVNTLKISADELVSRLKQEGIEAVPHPTLNNCLRLSHAGAVEKSICFQQGLFHVQDASSQICVQALGARPGECIFDVCAAPGGKSFTIAQNMENSGKLFSFDLYNHRTALIQEGAKRLGIDNLCAKARDASVYDPALGLADRVLCDVPCSGFGIIRRKPEIKYKPLDEVKNLPEIQYKILETSANYVKVGGILLYSTCTLSHHENEKVVRRFLKEHPEFSASPIEEEDAGMPGQRTLFPDSTHDGFFLQRFEKMR